jgi:hypothetical protein
MHRELALFSRAYLELITLHLISLGTERLDVKLRLGWFPPTIYWGIDTKNSLDILAPLDRS